MRRGRAPGHLAQGAGPVRPPPAWRRPRRLRPQVPRRYHLPGEWWRLARPPAARRPGRPPLVPPSAPVPTARHAPAGQRRPPRRRPPRAAPPAAPAAMPDPALAPELGRPASGWRRQRQPVWVGVRQGCDRARIRCGQQQWQARHDVCRGPAPLPGAGGSWRRQLTSAHAGSPSPPLLQPTPAQHGTAHSRSSAPGRAQEGRKALLRTAEPRWWEVVAAPSRSSPDGGGETPPAAAATAATSRPRRTGPPTQATRRTRPGGQAPAPSRQ